MSFSVGAEPERIAAAVRHAQTAMTDAGRSPDSLSFSAFVMAVVDEDIDRARALARPMAAIHLRLRSVSGNQLNDPGAPALESSVSGSSSDTPYQLRAHALASSPQAMSLTDDAIDRFAIIGSPARCLERLHQIRELGITRLFILPPAVDLSTFVNIPGGISSSSASRLRDHMASVIVDITPSSSPRSFLPL